MTTIVDPLGTPSAVYNRDGTSIQEINAAGTTGSGATQLTTVSQFSIYLVFTDDDETGVKLPADAEVGDFIEIYKTGSPTIRLYDSGNSNFLIDFSRAGIRRVKDSGTAAEQWKILAFS